VLQCVAVCYNVSQFVKVYCTVLQSVVVCCSMLRCVVEREKAKERARRMDEQQREIEYVFV